ncbi:BfmA/BtgA family mobilization protein [Arenibacter sp. ARW7G5Y1]|uniref:BfmA/BtgA family mobilization protein n=1 Tax=Arenibacter sp. ARW7G5Y1 TaxID=2135619 RepID=UPI000D775C98|nr:BfmA/BtgA family mobilization protein [Arenibacter sp. ARW7G5Y1]PXX23751.1 hypothetical protein C7972_11844 [Arenibacter sp. ARW7G5Y1]
MDHFYTIRFRRNTAQRFKRFSKKVATSYSEAMDMIIDFFEWHGFLPSDKFEKSVGKEVLKNRKRTEAAIAIIREIEKSQTKPTTAMLELLFEHSPQKRQGQPPLLIDGKGPDPERDRFFKKVEEAIAMEKDFTNLKRDFGELRTDFLNVLNRVELVKINFGKPRLQLDMAPEDFQKLKIRIEKQ